MLAKVFSCGLTGLEAYPITIEVDVSNGLPLTTIVGLPDNAVRESRERVRAAIRNSGYKFASRRTTINLAPADIKKEGPSFDLAIALGILSATKQIYLDKLNEYIILGELSLNGDIRPVHGVLPMALAIDGNRFKGIVLPHQNAKEASLARQLNIYPVKTLTQAIHTLSGIDDFKPFKSEIQSFFQNDPTCDMDFSDVKGQMYVKRGLEVAAAGGHNIALVGPPGSGKSMLAQRLPGILPDMNLKECLETTQIHSIAGLNGSNGLITRRPFRAPHHTTSDVALIGGGSIPKPGEISLAHNGILFLDELPEFGRSVLETLRQPLEDRYVNISRAVKSISYPSAFLLICAFNGCPCGRYGQAGINCQCSTTQVHKYRSKISGPLLDRIDIHLEVQSVRYQELSTKLPSESSAQIKERVDKARTVQIERFKEDGGIVCNARMSHRQVRRFCALEEKESNLLKQAMTELNFSARCYDKILKVSRTIADLDASDQIKTEHLAEAIQYRSLDREFFA